MATVILELKKIKFVTVSTLSSSICIYRRRQWHPTSVLLPGKSHGRRSLVGCRLWDREESDTTEWLHFHFSLSCIGEGNGNPLQCSCLENPRDGAAWWAAVYGVIQSWTWLKWLSIFAFTWWNAMNFIFWMLSFTPALSLYSFTLIKRLLYSSFLSATRVVSFAYLRLLIFLPEILILFCDSSSLAFPKMFLAFCVLVGDH